MDVSIILTVRQALGNPNVELEGEYENPDGGRENVLPLTRVEAKIIKLMMEFGGELIPESKELPVNKFFLAVKFASDEKKKMFLEKLPTIS